MEKIGSIVNRIVSSPKKSIDIARLFSSQEKRYIKNYRLKKDTLFVYVKSSPQAFELKLKQAFFLKKVQSNGFNITKIIFRVS